MRSFVLLFCFACGGHPTPKPEPSPTPEPTPSPTAKPERPARAVFSVGPSPMSIAVSGGALYWTDAAGSIFTMPASGGTPKQLSDQQHPDFAFKVVATGNVVVATSRKDLLRVDAGTVSKANVKGLVELPEEMVADAAAVYVTMFKRDEVMRIDGTTAKQIGKVARGVLALHGDTLYVASYSGGTITAIPTVGGKPRPIAKGLVRPTALAADDTHAYVYSEKDTTLSRIELASGKAEVIAKGLVNADDLVVDGDWLYTRSWAKASHGELLRLSKDGKTHQAIGTDLAAPYNIAVDDEAIYVTVRDAAQIVRFEKSALR